MNYKGGSVENCFGEQFMQEKMIINRENAMALWNERYGKELKVEDFAGRKIVKGAYGDRNSEFGWNLDHILPQSQGGKDTPSNLICCHILTNDDKADKFPAFVANERRFEIIKVQNHYEIKEVDENSDSNKSDSVDFFDPASAMRFLDQCEKGCFAGVVKIVLNGIVNYSIVDFISEIFSNYDVSISRDRYNSRNVTLEILTYDLPLKEDIQNVLDSCVMANTYLKFYFMNNKYLSGYDILFGVEHYNYHVEADDFNVEFPSIFGNNNMLLINEIVRINTEANKEELSRYNCTGYYSYDYSYIKLREKLEKLRKENK